MSTETITPPAPTSYDARPSYWRIANGVFCKGRPKEDGYQETKTVFGQLKAFGISKYHDDKTDEDIYKLWAEFANQEGAFGVNIKLRSAVGSALLGRALLEVEIGDWLGLRAVPSEDPEKKSTRVFADKWNGNAWAPVKLTKEFVGADSAAKLPAILDALRAMPGFRKPKTEEAIDYSTASQRECFDHEAQGKGWPALSTCQPEYLAIANALAKNLKIAAADTLDDVSEDVWQKLREGLGKAKEVPETLKKAAAVATDEYDPFADA